MMRYLCIRYSLKSFLKRYDSNKQTESLKKSLLTLKLFVLQTIEIKAKLSEIWKKRNSFINKNIFHLVSICLDKKFHSKFEKYAKFQKCFIA